jgi:hypothetical protein
MTNPLILRQKLHARTAYPDVPAGAGPALRDLACGTSALRPHLQCAQTARMRCMPPALQGHFHAPGMPEHDAIQVVQAKVAA